MSLTSQATLLRVLDAGTLRRIGGRNHIEVDVRVLAATNKEPAAALKTGVLRDDLYYRLNVLTVALPALRERPEDIPLLTEAFVAHANAQYGRRIRAVNGDALDALMAHAWPGNVRELQNRIERAVLLCPDDVVTRRCLSLNLGRLAAVGSESDAVRVSVGTQLRDCKKELILRTFAWADQNRTRAANLLGVSPKTLHNKLRRYRQAAPDTVAVGSATGHDGHSHDDDRHSP